MAVIYEVEGPDGKIHEIEGPEDATPDEIEAAAEEQFAAPKKDDGVSWKQVATGAALAGAGALALRGAFRKAFPGMAKNRSALQRLVKSHADDGLNFQRMWERYMAETAESTKPITYGDWFVSRPGAETLHTTKVLRDAPGLARRKDEINQAIARRDAAIPPEVKKAVKRGAAIPNEEEMIAKGNRLFSGKSALPPQPHALGSNLGDAAADLITGHPFRALGDLTRGARSAPSMHTNEAVNSVITDLALSPRRSPTLGLVDKEVQRYFSPASRAWDYSLPVGAGGLGAYTAYELYDDD